MKKQPDRTAVAVYLAERGDAILVKNLAPGVRPRFKRFCIDRGTTMQAALTAFIVHCVSSPKKKGNRV